MNTLLAPLCLAALLCVAAAASAQTKAAPSPDPVAVLKEQSKLPADGPVVKVPIPHTMSDKQRGDFWRAQYNVSQAELAVAKANIEALQKVLIDPVSKAREQVGQSIVQSCADAKIGPDGDIACPAAAKPEAPKPDARSAK